MLMDPHSSKQRVVLQHAVFQMQQEVIRPTEFTFFMKETCHTILPITIQVSYQYFQFSRD